MKESDEQTKSVNPVTLPAYIAFAIALGASVGSLVLSEIFEFPPCELCWYQRIAMYPIVFVVATGIVLRDARLWLYALPLAIAGLLVAGYHNLLYYGIIPQDLTPCSEGVSCTAKQLELFGFVTIPLLSLVSFVVLAAALVFCRTKEGNSNDQGN